MTSNTKKRAHETALGPQVQMGMGWLPEQAGGLNRYFHGLISQLNTGNRTRALVTADEAVPFERRSAGTAVRAFAKRDQTLPLRLWAARRALASELSGGASIVVAHFALYLFPGLNLLKSVPLVSHFHGPWAAETKREGDGKISNALKVGIEKAVYQKASRVITLSRSFAEIAHRRYGVDEQRLRVIPGGILTDEFDCGVSKTEARDALGWSQSRPIVLCVRRLVSRMGIENLIAAAGHLRQRHRDLLVLIGGKGPLAEPLQRRIEDEGLEKHVKLLGFISDHDLPLAYRGADLTIVPTESLEGFGLIAAESLAAGTPPLVTPVGGLPEVVSDLSTELVLGGSDVESLEQGLHSALAGQLSLPDALACQRYATERFSWDHVLPKLLAVYRECQ